MSTSDFSLPASRPGSGNQVRSFFRRHGATILRTYGVIFALIVLVVFVTAKDSTFLTAANLRNVTSQWAPAGIMAVGITYVIIVGELDVSIAANFSLCAIVAAYLGSQGHAPALCFLAAIALGAVIGMLNGLLIVGAEINSFIATLGTSFALQSVGQIMTNNVPYTLSNPGFLTLGSGRFLTVPYTSWILFLFLVVGGLVLARTIYGQSVYAVGGNREVSRLTGIRVKTVTASTFAISGLCAGVAGALSSSLLGSAQANLDPSILFDVITIVILGGTSLTGGFGAMWRTAVGLAIIATIANAFNLLNVDPNYQAIAKGTILVVALALDSYGRRLAATSRRRAAGAEPVAVVPTSTEATPAHAGRKELG
jgi:ribose transport system permease protein